MCISEIHPLSTQDIYLIGCIPGIHRSPPAVSLSFWGSPQGKIRRLFICTFGQFLSHVHSRMTATHLSFPFSSFIFSFSLALSSIPSTTLNAIHCSHDGIQLFSRCDETPSRKAGCYCGLILPILLFQLLGNTHRRRRSIPHRHRRHRTLPFSTSTPTKTSPHAAPQQRADLRHLSNKTSDTGQSTDGAILKVPPPSTPPSPGKILLSFCSPNYSKYDIQSSVVGWLRIWWLSTS